MRYINRESILADFPELVDAAEQARHEILREPDPTRRQEVIANNRDKWVAFRTAFSQLSHRKCWYTECMNPGTDDDIDHYRPKGRVAEDDEHGGYWWEALNWRNFRLSCHRANRLRENPDTGETYGKGDHFPLLNEGERCRAPGDDLNRERPLLLDPCDPFDPPLLTFDIDGSAALAPEYQSDAEADRRVQETRRYLHLDWPAIKEARQQLYRDIRTKVSDGEGQEKRYLSGELGGREALKATARDLIELAREDKPYSVAAKAYIARFRHIPWVNRAVLPHCA